MFWLAWWTACATVEQVLSPGPSPEDQALSEATALVEEAAKTMQVRMVQELGAKAPSPELAAGSAEPDALAWHAPSSVPPQGQVGISALRLRNPANRPPPWVKSWLQTHDGADYADVEGFARVEEAPEGRVARVLQPIPMLERCVRCHGAPEQIPPDVRAEIDRRYPGDASVGYEVGDLRGAVWAEVAVTGHE